MYTALWLRVLTCVVIVGFGFTSSSRAEITWRVSVKIILGPNGERPSGGSFDSPDEVRDSVAACNAILQQTGRGYFLDAEVVELHDVSEWFTRKARDPDNRSRLENEARAEPERFAFRQGAVNIYVNNRESGICIGPGFGEVIFIGTATSPITVMHEIGHYFGLCHTQGCDCNACNEQPPFEDCKSPKSDDIDDTLADLDCFDQNDIALFNFFPPLPYAALSPERQRQVDDVFHNVMSYHSDKDRLTGGQMDRMADISVSFRRHVTSGRTWFVDTATDCLIGDGSSDCSLDPLNLGGPFRTVDEGIDHAESGDIVLVREGHYPGTITIRKTVELRASRGPAILGTN